MSNHTPVEQTGFGKKMGGPVGWMDERLGLAKVSKANLRKVFPDHWSFLLGEIALWSFIVILATGIFLALFYEPSMAEVTYSGSYAPLRGIEMSAAYASTLDISFDVRGGLLLRQIHHWAAALFVAAMMMHMFRVFFTGAYRKPREINWLIGLGLLTFGLLGGFSGYSLPDDLLSGTGLRFVDGMIRSFPIVGSYLEFLVFGGEFPGSVIIPRLYIAHVLLIPGLILGLITFHMLLVVYHKHTQWPGPGRTEENVVGYPMLPVYAAKAGGFFFIVFGFIALLSALVQINPVWVYGPYNPSEVTAGSQPDWYMGMAEGAVRIMPAIETTFLGLTWSWNVFIPGVGALGLLFTVLGAWPFVERWITGDKEDHHLLERPRNNPTRTAFGVAGITFYGVLWAAGGNDIIALKLSMNIFVLTYIFRIALFVAPVVAFIITRRICIALQKRETETILHGHETGVIERSPQGGYSERHAPMEPATQYALTQRSQAPELTATPTEDVNGVKSPSSRRARLRDRARRFYYYGQTPKPTKEEMNEAAKHFLDHQGHVLPEGNDEFQGVTETGIPKQHR